MIESRRTVPLAESIFAADFEGLRVACGGREMWEERGDGLDAAVEGRGVNSFDGWRQGA